MQKNIIVISNNLIEKVPCMFPYDTIVRVNLAWMGGDYKKTRSAINNIKHDIYLDFPSGRTKPPKPVFTLSEALELARDCINVKYFAVSNVENAQRAFAISSLLRSGVRFVPKIETRVGVNNLVSILKKTKCKFIMLDKDDLWPDVKMNSKVFNQLVSKVREICHKKKVKLLELQGVVFS